MQEHAVTEAAYQAVATMRNDRYDFFAGVRDNAPPQIRETLPDKTGDEEMTESATATYWG